MKRWLVVLTVLSLLLLIVLPACGGGGGEKTPLPTPSSTSTYSPTPTVTMAPTATPTSTPTPTATPTIMVTPTPTPSEPIKIGAIGPWSGPMAMAGMLADQTIALMEEQVKNMGGILGGREVKFVRGDDVGAVAQDTAQATKLILDEKVSFLTLGGVSAPGITATAQVAEELKVPFVGFATIYGVKDMKYSACLYGSETVDSRIANFIIDYLKAKKVAFLQYDALDAHQVLDGEADVVGVRDRLKAAGIDIVYEQYFPQDTQDFSSYLTKIKYVNPDVAVVRCNQDSQAITVNKQIAELGGWGSIKYFGGTEPSAAPSAAKLPSALGTYTCALWIPGSDDPGMKAFEDAWVQKYKALPNPSLSYYYNVFWTAIKAIELAGSDAPDKVAQALRSGNLEWDSAWGHLRIPPNGTGEVSTMVAQVQAGGKLVKVYP